MWHVGYFGGVSDLRIDPDDVLKQASSSNGRLRAEDERKTVSC